jgi:thiol:disulfide interchange protein DsbD
MAYVRLFRFVTLLLMASWLVPAIAAGPKPADQVFRLSVALGEEDELQLNWTIEPGHYLYRDRFVATLGGKRVKLETAKGETKDDPTFGLTEVYHRLAAAYVDSVPEAGELLITYQGCGEDTICYPPVTKAIDLATLAVSDATARTGGPHDTSSAADLGRSSLFPVAGDVSTIGDDSRSLDGDYLSTLLTFLGFGLLLAFTPCTFPMLPILSGMLTRSAGSLSPGRGFVLSASYVLAMASAYGVLGIFAAWFGGSLQAAMQMPVTIVLMSGVFMILALSMFGLYELRLPQFLHATLLPAPDRSGSIGSAALLGFTSALIVGPCVTPPLAAALLYVAQTGNALRGSSALFSLGLGMGLPLLLLGTLGAAVLPKSGFWLVRIKQAFGVMLAGIGIWMASRILPLPLIAASWGVFFLGIGIWAFPSAWSLSRPMGRLRRGASLAAPAACATYGLLLLTGAIGGWHEPLQPLVWAGVAPTEQDWRQGNDGFQTVTNATDLDAAVTAGRDERRPVLIDFSADWCTECRLMERTILADGSVRRQLDGLLLVRADVTRYDAQSRQIMARFAVVGPPTMILLNSAGKEVDGTRTVGMTVVNDLLSKIAAAVRD